jgi:type III secretion protein T
MSELVALAKSYESTIIWIFVVSSRLYGFLTTTYVLPANAVGRLVRAVVALIFVLPMIHAQNAPDAIPPKFEFGLIAILAVEYFKGYMLGYALGWIFWVMEGIGNIIDNQRGAAIASAVNPLMGQEASPIAILFSQAVTVYFFAIGGMFVFFNVFYLSYAIFPAGSWIPNLDLRAAGALMTIFGRAMELLVLIAAPIVLVMFIVEFALAMVSRFAPQIQVFILAMPIKSAIAIFMMVFFFPIALDFALRPAARFYGEADFAVRLLGGERSYREVVPDLGPRR